MPGSKDYGDNFLGEIGCSFPFAAGARFFETGDELPLIFQDACPLVQDYRAVCAARSYGERQVEVYP